MDKKNIYKEYVLDKVAGLKQMTKILQAESKSSRLLKDMPMDKIHELSKDFNSALSGSRNGKESYPGDFRSFMDLRKKIQPHNPDPFHRVNEMGYPKTKQDAIKINQDIAVSNKRSDIINSGNHLKGRLVDDKDIDVNKDYFKGLGSDYSKNYSTPRQGDAYWLSKDPNVANHYAKSGHIAHIRPDNKMINGASPTDHPVLMKDTRKDSIDDLNKMKDRIKSFKQGDSFDNPNYERVFTYDKDHIKNNLKGIYATTKGSHYAKQGERLISVPRMRHLNDDEMAIAKKQLYGE